MSFFGAMPRDDSAVRSQRGSAGGALRSATGTRVRSRTAADCCTAVFMRSSASVPRTAPSAMPPGAALAARGPVNAFHANGGH